VSKRKGLVSRSLLLLQVIVIRWCECEWHDAITHLTVLRMPRAIP